jgi:hypothetical protein
MAPDADDTAVRTHGRQTPAQARSENRILIATYLIGLAGLVWAHVQGVL